LVSKTAKDTVKAITQKGNQKPRGHLGNHAKEVPKGALEFGDQEGFFEASVTSAT
jgi:hypothetical protein